jgi:hypothetical protein
MLARYKESFSIDNCTHGKLETTGKYKIAAFIKKCI